jgi:hypothetical protein
MIHANSICQEFSAYKTAARIDIHCELAAVPFSDLIITGFLSIYVPMNLFLYVYKMSFVDSLIYSLPFVVACILVVGILTFSKIRFSGDM